MSQPDIETLVPEDTGAPNPEPNTQDAASQQAAADDGAGDGNRTPEPPEGWEDLPRDVKGLQRALAESRSKNRDLEAQVHNVSGRMQAFETLMSGQNEPELTQEQIDEQNEQLLKSFAANPAGFVREATGPLVRAALMEYMTEEYRTNHADYDEVITDFIKRAKSDPTLHAAYNRSPNPVRYAYMTGKRLMEEEKRAAEFKNLGVSSLDELKEKIRKDVIAEIEGGENQSVRGSGVPKQSLAALRGGGGSQTKPFSGPPALAALLPE